VENLLTDNILVNIMVSLADNVHKEN